MSTDLSITVSTIEREVFSDNPSDKQLAELRDRWSGIDAIGTRADYQLVTSGIAECRNLRTRVEAARVELKRQVLDVGRAIDGEAKRIIQEISNVELPLRGLKETHDAKVEAERAAKEDAARKAREEEIRKEIEAKQAQQRAEAEAARKEMEAREAQLKAEREELERQKAAAEAEAAKIKAAAEAEAAKVAEARKAEEELLQAERKRQQEVAEQQRKEAERLEALRIEQQRIAQIEADRKEAEAREAARVAALPDWQAICFYLDEFENIQEPEPKNKEAQVFMERLRDSLQSFRIEAYDNVKDVEVAQ